MIEELMIYKQYVELINYTNSILLKYPKSERFSLASDIKKYTYSGLEYIIRTYKSYRKEDKLNNLFELDVKLKLLKVLVRVSYKDKYISSKNYAAWCRKIGNICNLMGGWISACQKQ